MLATSLPVESWRAGRVVRAYAKRMQTEVEERTPFGLEERPGRSETRPLRARIWRHGIDQIWGDPSAPEFRRDNAMATSRLGLIQGFIGERNQVTGTAFLVRNQACGPHADGHEITHLGHPVPNL